jgi:hypothetical protein
MLAMKSLSFPVHARTAAAAVLLAAATLLAASPAHADGRWRGGHRHGYHGPVHGYYGHGWRPYVGLHVHSLPALRSVVVVGGISYLLAHGVYYREHLDGGYVVVPAPMDDADRPMPLETLPAPRQFVYPKQGQSSERQSADEYDCHRWAADQSGFDPAAAATGHAPAADARRPDYQRAKSACLEGRGYTVR